MKQALGITEKGIQMTSKIKILILVLFSVIIIIGNYYAWRDRYNQWTPEPYWEGIGTIFQEQTEG